MRGRLSLYIVLPVVAVLLPFTSVSITDQILSYGIWAYLLILVVITFKAGGVYCTPSK
jgi:hypothetical protein